MSDAELSDLDDDVTRLQEVGDDVDADARSERANVSGDEVKDGENEGGEDAQKVDPVPTRKKPVRKMVVLNTERLKNNKGVHTIEKLYEGFKFNGKGHEKEDLDRMMKRLEYWAFRIFPKLDFDDFLDKCEHLGHKKDLQTFLKRYRLGLISADDMNMGEDIVEDEDKDEDNDLGRTETEMSTNTSSDAAFQRLLDESAPQRDAQAVQNVPRASTTSQVEIVDNSEFERLLSENVQGMLQEKEKDSNASHAEVLVNQNVPRSINTSQVEIMDDSEFERLFNESVQEAVQQKENDTNVAQVENENDLSVAQVQENQDMARPMDTSQVEGIDDAELDQLFNENVQGTAAGTKENSSAVVPSSATQMEIDDDAEFERMLAEDLQAVEEAAKKNAEQTS